MDRIRAGIAALPATPVGTSADDAARAPIRLVESGPTNEVFTNPTKQETEDYITGRFG